MNFFNRESEIEFLKSIEEKSKKNAQMTFVVGRRRIGKTSLLIEASSSSTFLYFFVARKNESLLCEEFLEEIKTKLNREFFGSIKSFKDLFGYIMELSKKSHFTLIIDEFQEFSNINPSIYSDMQNIWDRNKDKSNINLILCGSVYSLMKKIFEQSKEPLFGRATNKLHLKEFTIKALKEIISFYYPSYTKEDLLAFYLFTGGVAKYVELLVHANAFTKDDILKEIFSENSLFLEEGKNLLIEEFGKDYGNYFSILSLIASSKTSRPEIESILEMQTGGFLSRLETDYGIISKIKPIFDKTGSRNVKYKINDNFLQFWFRFIYKYRSTIEIGNLKHIKDIVLRDYDTYSGIVLEKYFKQKLTESQNYSMIGSYWERGNKNEIDIVAVNDFKKEITFFEVKKKEKKISIELLKQKSKKLVKGFDGYDFYYRGLSVGKM